MKWFNIEHAGDIAFVQIGGNIGCFGQTFEDFRAQLGSAKKVELFIDSDGGNAFYGYEMYKLLAPRSVIATVTGMACSSAVFSMMSAGKIQAFADSRIMVHAPVTCIFGTPNQLRAEADRLEALNRQIAAAVQSRTGQSADTVKGWFSGADHWFTAEQALAVGLVDRIIEREAPVTQATTAPSTAATSACLTDDEMLFEDFLRAFGNVRVRNRENFLSGLTSWAVSNILVEP